MTEEPADHELHAYIDDELDDAGRFAVETHLAARPDLAARVMADLSTRTGLRLLAHRKEQLSGHLLDDSAALAPSKARPFWRRAATVGGTGTSAAGTIV